MQDLYYNCTLCRLMLNITGFRDVSFKNTKKIESYEEFFPNALNVLYKIRNLAEAQEVKIAIINIHLDE